MALPLLADVYSVEKQTVDSIEVYVLKDTKRNVEVRVVPSIGNNAYSMTVNGKPVFWSPYKTLGEFKAKPVNLGNPFLWPWANRIDGTSYYANGKKYNLNLDIGNVRPGPANTPIHGLIMYSDQWKVIESTATAKGAVVRSRFEFSKYPQMMAQFPFAHTVDMIYRLADGALEVETVIENHTTEPMPVAAGYHPYFQVNDAPRDEWNVHLSAKEKMVLSDRLIPTGEKVAMPYPDPLPLKGAKLDDVFVSLKRDPDGWARFSVKGKNETVTVEYGPKYTVAVVYAPPGRDFICFEPMAAITNAFNAAHAGWYTELQSVPAGGSWREKFRIVPSGF